MVAEERGGGCTIPIVYAKILLKEFGPPEPSALSQAVDWIETHIGKHRIMVCCRAGMGGGVGAICIPVLRRRVELRGSREARADQTTRGSATSNIGRGH